MFRRFTVTADFPALALSSVRADSAADRAGRSRGGAASVLTAILLWFALVMTPLLATAEARLGAQKVDAVQAELVADVSRAVPGEPFRIGLHLRHDPGWHTYWRNPGDSGLPTRFEPGGPTGAAYSDIVWPMPRRLAIGGLANYGYEGEVVLARTVTLPASFDKTSARFDVVAQWLVCKEVCIPGEAALALEVPVGEQALPAPAEVVARFDDNAARAPQVDGALRAGWWQQGGQAFLVLPAGLSADSAEFFPYFEGMVTPAATQALVEIAATDSTAPTTTAPSRALRLAVSESEPLPDQAAGALQVDGRAIEIAIRRLAQAPDVGRIVSLAAVVPSAAAPAPGLLDRLRGRVGLADTAAASGSAVAPGAQGVSNAAVAASHATFGLAIIGALLGGLILNLMPCVFPVIGLKVLSFTQSARGDARIARLHAVIFSTGVVLSFLLLGVALLALRSAGASAGWGFQMQSPVFVGAMALLFVLIGLNLFGVFETGVSLTRLDVPGTAAARAGLLSSFWTGVIAVLVATPCTAPFMGSAVGFTLASPPLQTMLVFAALGLGMAAPYLVLGWMPQLLRWLPRPGPWLLVFKQLLAFPMLATAAWLAWVLTLQAGAEGTLRLLTAAILLAFAAWVYGRAQVARMAGRLPRFRGLGLVGLMAAVLAVAGTAWQMGQIGVLTGDRSAQMRVGPARTSQWQPWSVRSVSEALAQGRPVLVDFTAAWCISCQANKKFVLERDVVRQAFDAGHVTLLRADWTRRDPAITAELARFGRNGVPLYLVYTSADEPPRLLPELLTVDIVLAALGTGR